MESISVVLASAVITVVLIISYGYLYLSEKKKFILFWICSLLCLFITYLSRYAINDLGLEYDILTIINYTSTILGYLFIYKGLCEFFKNKCNYIWLILMIIFSTAYLVANIIGLFTDVILYFTNAYAASLLFNSGLITLNQQKPGGIIRKMVGCTFFIWAATILFYIPCRMLNLIQTPVVYLLVGASGLIAYISILAMYFQRVREELILKEENLRKYLVYDNLTGAYNRNYFEQTIKAFFNNNTVPVVFIFGDVNGLKLINDTFGHYKGDELLMDVVNLIKKSVRPEDMIIRWGGDEFIIVMPNANLAVADSVIKKIRYNASLFNPKTIPIELSLVTSCVYDSNYPVHEAIKHAEEKMYRNKLYESKKTRTTIIGFLEKLLWEKDYQTEEHVIRMKSLVCKVGKYIGLTPREIDDLSQVAMLHDIGKIGIPVEILRKNGPLTPEEWETMKKHSEIGYRIAQSTRELTNIAESILGHHEWWNGNGYPQGLEGEDIPLYSRIVTIADAYDVLTHERPYKKAVSKEEALRIIRKNSGIQFDPFLIEVFFNVINDDQDDIEASNG